MIANIRTNNSGSIVPSWSMLSKCDFNFMQNRAAVRIMFRVFPLHCQPLNLSMKHHLLGVT